MYVFDIKEFIPSIFQAITFQIIIQKDKIASKMAILKAILIALCAYYNSCINHSRLLCYLCRLIFKGSAGIHSYFADSYHTQLNIVKHFV
jgi:hypothetical protein